MLENETFRLSSLPGEIRGFASMAFNYRCLAFVQVVMIHLFRRIAIGHARMSLGGLSLHGTRNSSHRLDRHDPFTSSSPQISSSGRERRASASWESRRGENGPSHHASQTVKLLSIKLEQSSTSYSGYCHLHTAFFPFALCDKHGGVQ